MNRLDVNTTAAGSDLVLAELLDEISMKVKAGEPIDRETYLARFPEHATELSELLDAVHLAAAFGQGEHEEGGTGLPDVLVDGTLGDFRILREVGRGGMGIVYEAEQISLRRRVALKILPFAAVLDPRHLQRFKNEAVAAASLGHPNIVEVYGVGCERGVHFYAMRYIEGQTLAAVIDETRNDECGMRNNSVRNAHGLPTAAAGVPESVGNVLRGILAPPIDVERANLPHPSSFILSPSATDTSPIAALSTLRETRPRDFFRIVAELGIQAAEALDHAHQMGIVHRDIKPANLMVECSHTARSHLAYNHLAPRDEASKKATTFSSSMFHHAERDDYTPHLYITDFGLAHIEMSASLTMTGDVLGTLRYMSPEQADPTSAVLDHRTDIYSLGVTLYEMLTLRSAFPASDRQTLLRQIAHDDPHAPRKLNPAIPADLETIVLKATEKNSIDRYSSAGELAADLRRYLNQETIKAKPPSRLARVRKWSRRHRTVVATALGTFLVSLSLAGFLIVGAYRSERQQRQLAESARQEAQNSLAIARQAVDDMYRRVAMTWLAKETAPSVIQRDLLNRALTVFQQLAHEQPVDDASRKNVAEALERVGEIQNFFGKKHESARALQRSIELERQIEQSELTALRTMLRRHRKLTDVQIALSRWDEATQTYAAASEYARLLQSVDPATDDRLELSLHRLLASELAAQAERLDEAERVLRSAIDDLTKLVHEERERVDCEVALLRAQLSLANVLRRLDRLAEAEEQCRQTLANIKGLIRDRFHDSREMAQLAAEAHDQFASVALDLNEPEVAVGHLRDALQLKQENLRGKKRPIECVMNSYFGFGLKNRLNFEENYEVVPFCSFAETQLRLAQALVKAGRPYEAETELGECLLTANLLCAGQDGHDLRFMLLYGSAWSAAADLMASDRPDDVDHFQRAADYVWLGIAAYFPQAIYHSDLSKAARDRIAWHIEHRAASQADGRARNYKLLATSPVWKTGFVEQALGLSWRYSGSDAGIGSLQRSAALRKSGQAYDWLHIAMAYQQKGKHEEAQKWLKQAIEAMGDQLTADLVELRADAKKLIGN